MLAFIPGQKPYERPEVGTRVFKLKLTDLLDDLTKIKYSAKLVQKRGLPHAHIWLWLKEEWKCKTSSQIDDIISAEIPSPTTDPEGYKVVTEFMLHDPCGKGAACTAEGIQRSKAIKYLFKYLNKGSGRATFVIQENVQKDAHGQPEKVAAVDEIKNYLNCRYLASCEAVWRLFSFDIHYSYPLVMKLNFHLEGHQNHNVARGPRGFKELMTVNKKLYPAFKEACFTYGLLNDDKEWAHAISESSFWALGPQLRDLFVTMLLFCDVSRPLELWEQTWELLAEDILSRKPLDRTLRDILGYKNPEKRNTIFGGVTILLGGEFRQIFSVIPKGKRAEIVQACINRLELWKSCKVFTLTQSMRVNEYSVNGEIDNRKKQFNKWVLDVGDGTMEAKKGRRAPGNLDLNSRRFYY
ncbi:ATP-dependent DNA helicase PIF1-like protein [Tanacetum coccineum]